MLIVKKDKDVGVLVYLFLVAGFFFLIELSLFLQSIKSYVQDFIFVTNKIQLPTVIFPQILFFITIQLILPFIFSLLVWLVLELVAKVIPLIRQRKFFFGLSFWFWGMITVLLANQYYFPNSNFSALTAIIFSNLIIAKYTLLFFFSVCCFFIFIAIVSALISIVTNAWRLSIFVMCAFLIAAILMANPFAKQNQPAIFIKNKPNIILIGVDSLRPDFLSYFGAKNATPFMDAFLRQAIVFSEALTPLARTFPSWSSLLTGEYPKQTSIRSNLVNQAHLDLSHTLAAILKNQGYQTIYATDEVRFSNIDKNFGFNKIITPPMGVNDFLIGNFNDFPLSNLIVNTNLGKWLFPYSYANRAVFYTYHPSSFLQLIKSGLNDKSDQPLFLAAHFCLAHFPYIWSDLYSTKLKPHERYINSIVKVDQQLSGLLTMLKEKHLLEHAIVILLSDHGEALELAGDRVTEKELFISEKHNQAAPIFYPASLDNEEFNQSIGHGTDVLGLPQYHTVLAFQLLGMGNYNAKLVKGVVSLLDIKPTLLTLLNLPITHASGVSLAGILSNTQASLPLRHLFLESDYSPQSIRTIYPETREILLQGINFFEVNNVNARLTVKPSMMVKIINSKQFADIYGSWMLALYPQEKKCYIPILIDLDSGFWTNNLQSAFAKQSPAINMLAKLKQFYSDELFTSRLTCSQNAYSNPKL